MDRIKYVDALKFLAITAIVLQHIICFWDTTGILNITFADIEEVIKFGVPIFLMLTGMLTLNKEIELKEFFKKKFVRIICPFAFFLLIAYVTGVYDSFLTVYWYCWMIIAMYLAIPIINVFIRNAKDNEIEYYVIMFLLASLIYSIAKIFEVRMALDLDFFIGPAAYLILGYYISRKDFKLSPNSLAVISLIVFIAASIFKVYFYTPLFINASSIISSHLNFALPQIIQVAALFLFIKSVYESSRGLFGKIRSVLETKYVNGIILSISRSSYGIYLVHMIILRKFIHPVVKNTHMSGTNTMITVIVLTTGLLLVSWIIIVILSRIPYVNKVSGYA